MGSILVEFGTPESGREYLFHLGRLEVDSGSGFHFSSDEEEERCLTLGLNSKSRGKLASLLGPECTLMLVWKRSSGLLFSLTDFHEEIPSIEEMNGVGTFREFLGAVLSKRDRLRRGARTA